MPKTSACYIVVSYREAHGSNAGNGIHFNDESPRRGKTFGILKTTRAVARIVLGPQNFLCLGNPVRRVMGLGPDTALGWLSGAQFRCAVPELGIPVECSRNAEQRIGAAVGVVQAAGEIKADREVGLIIFVEGTCATSAHLS